MSEEQPLSGGNGGGLPPLPTGAAPHDHAGWRLAFRLVDLGAGSNDSASWSQFARITIWIVVALATIGMIIWVAGPWVGLGGGGAYGLTKAGKALHRKVTDRGKEITSGPQA
jgi:hypothetical protein